MLLKAIEYILVPQRSREAYIYKKSFALVAKPLHAQASGKVIRQVTFIAEQRLELDVGNDNKEGVAT